MINTDVECYSGSSYAEKPVAFVHDGRRYRVAAVVTEKQLENGKWFLVRTDEDLLFQLFYDISRDQWEVSYL